MPSQRFDDGHLFAPSSSLLSPRLQMSSYAAPILRSEGMTAGTMNAEAEWPAEAFVNLYNLAKGVGWALAIEGIAALSICSIFYLWHLWR